MEDFSKDAFEGTDDAGRQALAAALATSLAESLAGAREFHAGVRELVARLRALGHDLWNFDESDDREVWCPNYRTPSGPGLVVTFTSTGVDVDWSQH